MSFLLEDSIVSYILGIFISILNLCFIENYINNPQFKSLNGQEERRAAKTRKNTARDF